ncbi:MAG: OsmC family peroxiredoxin [Balneolaceae bacterium]|nr:OsmC family peroxiredoxin [Balneolaceae bacterium]
MKHTYTATVEWINTRDSFTKNTYSRKHHWTFDGGITVPASASPQVVREPFSEPEAVDPEEAFVASVSSCHMLFFLSIAAKGGFEVKSYTDRACGIMQKNEEGDISITEIQLEPNIEFSGENIPDDVQIQKMHHQAHKKCFIANSIKSKVVVKD